MKLSSPPHTWKRTHKHTHVQNKHKTFIFIHKPIQKHRDAHTNSFSVDNQFWVPWLCVFVSPDYLLMRAGDGEFPSIVLLSKKKNCSPKLVQGFLRFLTKWKQALRCTKAAKYEVDNASGTVSRQDPLNKTARDLIHFERTWTGSLCLKAAFFFSSPSRIVSWQMNETGQCVRGQTGLPIRNA